MTAPVTTPVTTAPASSTSPSAPNHGTMDSVISRISMKAPALAAAPAPVPAPIVAPTAPVVPAPGVDQVAPSAPVVPPVAVDGVPPITDAPQGPTGQVVVDGGDVTLTAERNADGTYKTQIDPSQKFDFTIKDKQTGETKVFSKTVPEIMRLARDGFAVQRVHDELGTLRKQVPQLTQTTQTLQQQIAEHRDALDAQMALNRELLTAPDEQVIRRREEFAAEMSPEKELARLKERIRQQDEQTTRTTQQRELSQQASTFVQTRLSSVIANAEAQVGNEAVAGFLALHTMPLMVNGHIPPAHWTHLETLVNGPFKAWVATEAAKRQSAGTDAAHTSTRRAQAEAQRLANTVGQSIRPVGTAGADRAAPRTPPTSAQDAINRIIHKPVAISG